MLFRNQVGKAKLFVFTSNRFNLTARILILFSVFTFGFDVAGNAPAPGVTAQLLFDEGNGTSAADGSGNSHTGTLTNGPTWTPGKYGQAVNFDGSNDYVGIADHNNFTLDPATSYTWSAWVRSANMREWSTLWSQTISTSSHFYFYAHSSTSVEAGPVTNGISIYWWSSNTNKLVVHSTNNVLTIGQWSYVTVTYDATQAQASRFTIYINGADVTARNDVVSTGTIATLNPTNTRIGSNQPYGEYFTGAIDELRYYRRLLSAAEIVSDMNSGNTGDTQAPTVSITAPTGGSSISGTVNATANATDNIGVTGVQFLLDGVNLGAEDISSPYSVSWNTTTATNGSHTLTARARDAAGNTTVSSNTTITVNNPDIQAPTVSITSPTGGSTVSGTATTISATAADNIGVVAVQFLLDGVNLGVEDVSAPYSIAWNTTTATNGAHILTARARDAAGNTTVSANTSVTVNNSDTQAPAISISAPANNATVSGTATTVSASASDNVGVIGVQFLLDGVNLGAEDVSSPYSISWNTTTIANGVHTLSARARDAAGNNTVSGSISVTVSNTTDTQNPTVAITAPAAGATVSGTVNLAASASDNIAVVGVQFLVDGVNVGTEDLSSPYAVSWNTTAATNGAHSITARARDATGNTTTSSPVSVSVLNTSLVAAYAFGENAGLVANDNSGRGNNGTLSNGPVWSTTGKYGTALSFDGSNDLVDIADAASLDLTNGMTLEAWINPSNLTGYKTILSKENGTNNLAYALSANNNTSGTANQRPNSRIRIGTNTRTVTGTSKIALNTWTHIASTYDGTTMRLYINGVQVSTFATAGNITATTNLFRIGGSPALGSQYFTGLIDEVRIYNRALSQSEIQTDMNTPIAPDQTAPAVSITAPANAATVSGTLNITANASDNVAVSGVQFLLDGNNIGTEDVTSPYSVSWNTTTATNGSHVLTARARDAAGNTTTSSQVSVTVNNDTEAPTVNISLPAQAATVAGTIDIVADAADNTAVTGVQFIVDGVNFGAEDVTSPYSISLNTTTLADGSHTIAARARDAANNTVTSAIISVSVVNTVPDTEQPTVNITAPLQASTVAGTISITSNATDNTGVTGVQFLLDGNPLGAEDLTAPYTLSWNTLAVANGPHIITARARDAAGNNSLSAEISIAVDNDTEFPLISITSPSAGTVTGLIDISAEATDNKGVVGVQFLLDNVNLGAEDLVSLYTISWNSELVTNGTHTLTAKARDAVGNITTSQTVTISVNNVDAVPPVISITSPAAGNVSGTVSIAATATDNIAVAGVQFLIDNNNLGSEDVSSPYSGSLNTLSIANGQHTITAIARDAAGNTSVSGNVVVTVNNDLEAPSANITSPLANATVSGVINVTANASDNVSVTGVQFLLDGNNLGSEDLSAPYSVSWTTTGVSNGTHILTARARDLAGNTTLSAPVTVTVSNTTNLISAHHFNEGVNTSAADISGNNHNGTLINGPTWSAGKYGQALNFDGTNDYVNIADHNNFTLDPTQSYTWSAWVKNNSFKEWSTVWSQTISQSVFFYFYAHTTTDPDGGPVTNGVSVYWWMGNNIKLGAHSSNNVLTTGQWSHITVTYNAAQPQNNRFSIYVNGVDVTVRTDVASVGTITTINPTNIQIGANNPFGEYLNGAIDEVRFYRRLLSATEVATDMNTPIGIDNTPPSVSITSPANNGSVAGSVTVNANAADNFGVTGVQFLLDGVNLGTEDLTAPFSITWNTETAANGPHILTARARDAAGNTTTSAEVAVTIAADFSFDLLVPVKNVEITGSTDFRISVAYLNGFATSSGIDLWFEGLPATVTGHYLFDPMVHQGETQLLLNTNNAPLGSYTFTMGATAEGITHTRQATLNITAAADFAVTASPSIQNVTTGNAATFAVNVNETNDFVNPVTLSVLGLPAGITASFNPAAPIPAALATLTLTTSTSTAPGTYNLTVQGVSGATTRTIPITLIVSSASSVWTVSTIGSTGVPNNTVRLGKMKTDGLERLYIGTIATGRMLEYTWNGSGWTGPLDIGGSPSGQEIHNCTIGAGRGDGKQRLYAASYDNNIYEIWNDASGWHQITVGSVGNLGMHTVVGDGRNDGVTRLYAASTQELYEFTWNGTVWTRILIGNTPGSHELALGNGRRDGLNRVYISSISSGNFEASYNGSSWSIVSMGDDGDARGLELGEGRNDGILRIYSAMYDGRVREFTWNGSAWTFVNMPMSGTQNIHAYIVPGRNDGFKRVYTCNANGKLFEYTWNGSSWDIYNMGGGSDYMYGLHYGPGRNDGVIRFYGADRGSVNRVYEFTWTVPQLITHIRKQLNDTYIFSGKK